MGNLPKKGNFDLNGKRFFKTHNAAVECGGEKFPLTDTSNGVIYIVRDPRDVIISYSNHYRIEPREAFDRMRSQHNHIWATDSLERFELLSRWDNHVLSWNSLSIPKLFLRYEDMLETPELSIEKIFEFLDLEPVISTEKIVDLTNFANLSKQEAVKGFNEAVNGATFFKQGKSEQWKDLDLSLLNEITDAFGTAMDAFGLRLVSNGLDFNVCSVSGNAYEILLEKDTEYLSYLSHTHLTRIQRLEP